MKDICVYIIFSIQLLDIVLTEEGTHYCDPENKHVIIDARRSGRLITRYEGDSFYKNSQKCIWRLDSGSPSRHIQLIIESTHLEWAPVNAICNGYDFVKITDDQDSQSGQWIVAWCGERNPRSVTSSGQYLYVTFQSNDRNQFSYVGASILFLIFDKGPGLGVCPPGWSDDHTLTDGGKYCYVVKNHTATWTKAQQFCGYDQANLASAADKRELQLLQELGKSRFGASRSKMWIGLNDIEVDEEYKWIDEITSTVKYRWRTDHEKSEYLNCVVIDSVDGLWDEQFCNENNIKTPVEHFFICKCNKNGKTRVYRAPQQRLEKGGSSGLDLPIPWIVIGVIAGVAVLIAAAVLVIKYGHLCEKSGNKRRTSSAGSVSIPMTTRDPPTAPAARTPPYTDSTSPVSSGTYQQGAATAYPSAPDECPPAYDDIVKYK